ncbi:MAG: DUF2087 domain-containing protein [Firmicutes bacterium]|nr:DUF2087 domain-containing protein [Bacillota bacterium]
MTVVFSDRNIQRRDAEYRRRVIVSFFEYGKLKSIPTQRKKKRIALEEIVKALAWDRIYTEKEVNIIIADFHEDFCTIRRDLISEKLMGREDNRYWRLKI